MVVLRGDKDECIGDCYPCPDLGLGSAARREKSVLRQRDLGEIDPLDLDGPAIPPPTPRRRSGSGCPTGRG